MAENGPSQETTRSPKGSDCTTTVVPGDRPEPVEITSALFATDLVLTYPTSVSPVIDCRRIDIPEGEITALVGPNGSGKSTLLKALSRHLGPDQGEIVLQGQALEAYGRKELARTLGHLSQENVAPGSVTVEELVYHGRYPHRSFFEAVSREDRAIVDRAIEMAGVDHLRRNDVGQLSGGQKQLVWVAMVLAQDTDVLLLDEPTSSLDLNHQLRVMGTLRRLNQDSGVTIAVVLHDIARAVRNADYLIALEDGGVYDWGPPRSVVTEELLADVFEVEATVERAPDGVPRVFPERPIHD